MSIKNIFKKYFLLILIAILIPIFVYSAALPGYQGGTGFGPTTSVSNVGKFLKLTSSSPYITYDFSTPIGNVTSTLQQVTDAGNTTTNPIQFAGGTSTAAFTAQGLLSAPTGSFPYLYATTTDFTFATIGTLIGSNATITNVSSTNQTISTFLDVTGAAITGLSTADLSDASNIAFLNANNIFSNNNTFVTITASNVSTTALTINGSTVCLTNGSNCPTTSTPNLQLVTNSGNTTTNTIVFAGGTSTAAFTVQGLSTATTVSTTGDSSVGGNFSVAGTATLAGISAATIATTNLTATNALFTNVTTTNITSTQLFATNATIANALFTNVTSTNVTTTNLNATTVSTTGNSSVGGAFRVIGATTLGAVVAGSLSLTTPLALTSGGTNASLTASNGGIFYSTASAGAILSGTATAGQILRSGASSAPSWSTATFPATAGTAGGVLRSDGTNFTASTALYPNTTAINQILYSSAANTIGGITTANNGVLVTDGSGVPSIGSTLPTAVQNNITSLGSLTNLTAVNALFTNVTTTRITSTDHFSTNATITNALFTNVTSTYVTTTYFNALTAAKAAALTVTGISDLQGQVFIGSGGLAVNGGITGLGITSTNIFATNSTIGTLSLTNPLSLTNGGTNASLTASNGGIFYSTASAAAILSGTATAGQIIRSGANTTPSWSTATYPATTAVSQILYSSSANVIGGITTANNGVLVTDSGGVPSIGSTLPSAVQGNITSLGTIANLTATNATITNGLFTNVTSTGVTSTNLYVSGNTTLSNYTNPITQTNSMASLGTSPFNITQTCTTFEDTGITITLPSAGTYYVFANIRALANTSVGTGGYIAVRLNNNTDATAIANSERIGPDVAVVSQQFYQTIPIDEIITVAASKVINVWACRGGGVTYNTSAIYSNVDGRSRLGYIKISP